MFNFRLPHINSLTEKGQIDQLKAYLFQLVEELQWAMNNLENGGGQAFSDVRTSSAVPNIIVDKSLSNTSTNPVQNKAVKKALDKTYDDIEAAVQVAERAESIAKGRATGYVFDTYNDLVLWLEVEENVLKLNQGDNLYIIDKEVPDYWWDGTEKQELETQKVDLSGFALKATVEDIINGTTKVKKAEETEKLTNGRKIILSGDATGETTFDGTADRAITLTLKNSGVTAGTYSAVTVDEKGRVTKGMKSIEWGEGEQSTSSEKLTVGGLFFEPVNAEEET